MFPQSAHFPIEAAIDFLDACFRRIFRFIGKDPFPYLDLSIDTYMPGWLKVGMIIADLRISYYLHAQVWSQAVYDLIQEERGSKPRQQDRSSCYMP